MAHSTWSHIRHVRVHISHLIQSSNWGGVYISRDNREHLYVFIMQAVLTINYIEPRL